ncbi:MAG: hypothetical protein QNJ53_17105 [Pleurocapsa sp. MO_192.B19]|nr:hypothetical protein [Pleurocapsa sp. MO_192.B19]
MSINTQQFTLQEVIQSWKDRIVCHPPRGEGAEAYIINSSTGDRLKYIEASCDSLRHNATNYDRLLVEIKAKHTGIYKEAVLNTIKYEATRRAFKTQHEWIHNSYQGLINNVKNNNFDRQMLVKIDSLNKMVATRDRELKKLKSECKGGLKELQSAYKKLQRQFEKEKQHRQKLGISNKSLGAYKGHFRKAQKKIAFLKTENNNLQKQVSLLEFKTKKANC